MILTNLKFFIRQQISSQEFLSVILHWLIRIVNHKSFFNAKNQSCSHRFPIYTYDFKPPSYPLYPTDSCIDNAMYGIGQTILSYAGINRHSKCFIEHGVFFGNHIQFDQKNHWTNKIITMSRTRVEHLLCRNIKRPILPIGPYIMYAPSIISSPEYTNLKRTLGRTLLVIPSHTSSGFQAIQDESSFIDIVNDLSSGYQSVIILLYYLDLMNSDRCLAYQKAGFKIFCAGHKYDPSFLSRLRTIIELSDYTVSNSVGTHVGYCAALGKPHYIINSNAREVAFSSNTSHFRSHYDSCRLSEIKNVLSVFDEYSDSLTPDQEYIVDKYWGTSMFRKPECIRNFILGS